MFNLLFILGACTGTGPDDSGSDTSDTGTHTGETGGDAIEAPFDVVLPDGISGEISITFTGEDTSAGSDDEVSGVCHEGLPCTFVADQVGYYVVQVSSDTALFQGKAVYADKTGAFPESVSWAANGCQDSGWTPDAHTACSSWLPGEWGMSPDGTYRDQNRDEADIDAKFSSDVTGDGIADIVLEIVYETGGSLSPTLAGNQFYGVDDGWAVAGTISSDLQEIDSCDWNTEDSTINYSHAYELE